MSHITCCYIFQKRKSFRGMSADSADSTRIPQGMGGECKVLTTGRNPFKGIEGQTTANHSAAEYIERFKEMWKTAKQNLEKAAERMKQQHDKHVKPSRQYQPGDRVY